MSEWAMPARAWRLDSEDPHVAAGQRTLFRTKSAGGGVSAVLSQHNGFDTKARIDSPYQESAWVHSCLKAKGQAVASVELQFWNGDPRLKKTADLLPPEHALHALFRRPSQVATMAQFLEAGSIHRSLDGEDFWLLIDRDGNPSRADSRLQIELPRWMYTIRGRAVSHRVNSQGFIESWKISGLRQIGYEAPPSAMVQFRDYDPDNPLRGLGDVSVLLGDIDLEYQAARYQRAVILNSGDPGGTITIEGQLAPDEAEAAEEEAQEKFSSRNAGRWHLITGKGIKYEAHKLSPKDMDFKEMLRWIRSKVASVLGVPLPVLGDLDRATFSNFEEAVKLFWQAGNGILAYLHSVEDVVNGFFLPRVRGMEGIVARFDTSRIKALQEDESAQVELAGRLVALGVGASLEEALALVRLDRDTSKMKYSDVHLVPGGLRPIDDVLAGKPPPGFEPPQDPDDPEEEPEGDPEEDEGEEDPEPPSDDEKAAATAAITRSEDDAFAERRRYWDGVEERVVTRTRADVKRRYLTWKRRYEKAQFARLRAYAHEGRSAPRFRTAVHKDDPDDVHPDLIQELEILLVESSEWAAKMTKDMRPVFKSVIEQALEDMAAELGVEMIDVESPQVLRFLENQTIRLAEGHTSTLANQVREVIVEALSNVDATGNLQQMLTEILPELEGSLRAAFSDRESRAATIAQTEVNKATNGARFIEMQAEGITEHTWISSRDAAVRGTPGGPYEDAEFSHAEIDGQTAGIGRAFAGHPNLKFPGDPDAPPGDTINCRCVTRPERIRNEDDS